jgi:transposase
MAKRTKTQWREHVARWKSSGLSMKDYAATAGLNAGTMRWWSRKFELEPLSAVASGQLGFVEVRAPVVVPASERLELVLRNGVVVRVPTVFDAGALRQVIALVEVC